MIHDGGWTLKYILILGFYVTCFWIPLSFFHGWSWVSQYISVLFQIFQAFYVTAGAMTLNDYFMSMRLESSDETCRNIFLLFTSLLCTGTCITLLIFTYFSSADIQTAPDEAQNLVTPNPPDCSQNRTLSIISTVICLIVLILGFLEGSSIFTNSIVNFWLAYLLWSALFS